MLTYIFTEEPDEMCSNILAHFLEIKNLRRELYLKRENNSIRLDNMRLIRCIEEIENDIIESDISNSIYKDITIFINIEKYLTNFTNELKMLCKKLDIVPMIIPYNSISMDKVQNSIKIYSRTNVYKNKDSNVFYHKEYILFEELKERIVIIDNE